MTALPQASFLVLSKFVKLSTTHFLPRSTHFLLNKYNDFLSRSERVERLLMYQTDRAIQWLEHNESNEGIDRSSRQGISFTDNALHLTPTYFIP